MYLAYSSKTPRNKRALHNYASVILLMILAHNETINEI